MCSGLVMVTVRRNLSVAKPGGIGLGAGGSPSFWARFLRITFPYVSLSPRENIQTPTPEKRIVHCVHLHPLNSAAKPPTAGPKAGPKKTVIRKIEDALARWIGSHKSRLVPAATAKHGEPKDRKSTRLNS